MPETHEDNIESKAVLISIPGLIEGGSKVVDTTKTEE